MNKKKCSSPVWAYFGFKAHDDGSVDETSPICRICESSVSAKSGNTSNLFSHLKHKHPRQYADLQSTRTSTKAGESSQKRPSSSDQPTLQQTQAYPRSSKRWQQLTDSVAYTIAKDGLPFTAVEKPGFKRMLATFDRRYEPPSRKYFSKTAIPRLYSSVKETVETKIASMKFFSSTTDLWSSGTQHPYMSFTIHYITENWEMKTSCLQTQFLPSDHTGDNLAEALESVLEAWNLKKEQQVCITTDNGSNIVCATGKLQWQRLSCFGHNLNLAVTKAMRNDHRISRALGLARSIVSAFSFSWKRKRDLSAAQVSKNLPQHSLISVSMNGFN